MIDALTKVIAHVSHTRQGHLAVGSWLCLAVAAILSIVSLPPPAGAGTATDESGVCGLAGFAAVGEIQGFGLELQLANHWSHMFVGGRLLTAAELDLLDWNGPEEPRRLFELGPIVGLRSGWRFVQAEIYAGVSYVSGEWYDDSAYKSKNAVGVPIGACVLLAPTREIGIGIGAFQNFNGVKSFSGGAMVFTLWR